MVGGYPVTDDSQSPNSFVTGAGLSELNSTMSLMISEYRDIIKTGITAMDEKRLEMDVVLSYSTGVTATGYSPGYSGSIVTFQPPYPDAPSDLRYYCTSHGNAMGNTITMNNPNTTTTTTTTTSGSQTNPFGTPSADKFPDEIYFLDRKVLENREFVKYELVSALDLTNVRVPKRQITRKDFPGVGTFIDQ